MEINVHVNVALLTSKDRMPGTTRGYYGRPTGGDDVCLAATGSDEEEALPFSRSVAK